MVLAFVEDGTAYVYPSDAEAFVAWEGLDAEAGVVKFYAEDGTYLEPVFTEPNQERRILGLFSVCQSGVYHLEPRPGATEDPLWVALLEHPLLEEGGLFGSMEELKAHLRSKGAVVERPEPEL